jgi:hypothetical protein
VNYTDRATAACRAKLMPIFADSGLSHGQRGVSPKAVFSVFYYMPHIFVIVRQSKCNNSNMLAIARNSNTDCSKIAFYDLLMM